MLAKVLNDFLTPIRKNCCRSSSCGSACRYCQRQQTLRAELQAIADQTNDRAAFLRLAETLTAFLARLRSAAETLSVMERQRIVRLLVKDVLVGEDTITIRHSIPIPSGPPQNRGSEAPNGQNYLLCKGRDDRPLGSSLFGCPSFRRLHDLCRQERIYQLEHFSVRHLLTHLLFQGGVWNRVKVAFQIGINNPPISCCQ